jgi:thiol-disulfide isomerase/thioredoxin
MGMLSGTAGARVEGHLPRFDGATAWLGSPPLSASDLRGKVVLVDFWTFTCINWLRTAPYIRAWADRYRADGLVVIGVHTPEFGFEHDVDSVRAVIANRGIDYPVVVDNDYAVWTAFGNHYWPALYFVDAEGAIRHHHFGEGEYARSERVIQELLAEAGARDVDRRAVTVEGTGDEAEADWGALGSPETYLGYERTDNFASPGRAALNEPRAYAVPEELHLNQWALSGTWTLEAGGISLNEPAGGIAFRFRARDVHLVMGPTAAGHPVPFRVTLDGEPPGAAHGTDVGEDGEGVATERRLHQLVRQPEVVGERTFEVTFAEPGVGAYVFTFG